MRTVARRPVEKRPHSPQRTAWCAPVPPITMSEPSPFVTLSFSRAISPQGKNAELVVARRFEQWQLNAATNSSETS